MKLTENTRSTPAQGLYRPAFERDNCGFGLMANMDGVASHWLVETAIQALERMTHRGAVSADGKTGDGCGLLLSLPKKFLRKEAERLGFRLERLWTAGMIFLDSDETLAQKARQTLEEQLQAQGLSVAGWREVPIDTAACGEMALATLPRIEQVFVNGPQRGDKAKFERRLFVARKLAENALKGECPAFYVCSLSAHTLSYKGMVMPGYLTRFYLDLQDEDLEASIAVFHQRFSTNTLPQWRLAQPFRFLAHNGEINTIQGNRNWALARSMKMSSPLLPDLQELMPLVSSDDSDSASLDNMLEVLLEGGLDIFVSMRVLVPPAWQNVDTMSPDLRAFYEYHSLQMDPWDGPAGIVLTDGRYAACCLDRNGLRPARYVITGDRHITLSSEVGVWDYTPDQVVIKGRLGPGEMLAVDTHTGELLNSAAIDRKLIARAPYKRWLKKGVRYLESRLDEAPPASDVLDAERLKIYEKLFNVTEEEKQQVLCPLANLGQEAIGSMGDDTPLPVLSHHVRPLYEYFRQQFAQVTNPPIDPIREATVMSLETLFGAEANIFETNEEQAKRIVIDSPVLSERKYLDLLAQEDPDYRHRVIDLNRPAEQPLEAAIEAICAEAEQAVREGVTILVLSDRNISRETLPVHALLATGAVHHHLVQISLRCDANLVIDTATARDSHHFACLIGYGATAVYPYLAYETLHKLSQQHGELDEWQLNQVMKRYRRGISKGLYKILSKMGISTIASYRGAQLFEIVGLDNQVTERCFRGTTSRVEGAGFEDLHEDQQILARRAWVARKPVAQGGIYKYIHGSEYHAYNPDVIQSLQLAVRTGEKAQYQVFADHVNRRPPMVLRDLLQLKKAEKPLPLEQVQAVEEILPRFETAGMSLGALSPEAHETLAIAMNRIGGRSNSGEGGEHISRYGTEKRSKIRQVASGRFGVTPMYLSHAEVLQIKIAQGAKPGEGGQLPGHKVDKVIAELRYAVPGVGLISPPPHHDIYSIEDLAQLIFDLKQVNPDALVSVKLVSEPGVGTIAAGVTKAYADLITISGYDGGTGASPLTSVKYAGSPWELGLSETHQVLLQNNLRSRVRLQTDGGLKTGLDVVKAAILGAESFGFGTAPMVAMGCKYLRICHLNNCATGVATQNLTLRKQHFIGKADMIINYFCFVAEEVREILAELGFSRLEDIIGRTDLLEVLPGETKKQRKLDLTPLLHQVPHEGKPYCTEPKNPPFDKGELAEQMVADMREAILNKQGGEFAYEIRNTNRSIGARVSGFIAREHGDQGMADAPITVRLRGNAGQSFGAFNAGGLLLELEGDANDYVGKGMAGGRLVLRPPANHRFVAEETPIMGNTCLYGATGGQLFAAGQAGERFAVRNSGALAVVEGVGDHGCEYMTGGTVVVLGKTGINFGAGMTGGFAYVLDRERQFVDRYNHELIEIHRISNEAMEAHAHHLRHLIEDHVRHTGSAFGQEILDNWRDFVGLFWLVKPKAADIETLLESMRQAA